MATREPEFGISVMEFKLMWQLPVYLVYLDSFIHVFAVIQAYRVLHALNLVISAFPVLLTRSAYLLYAFLFLLTEEYQQTSVQE